MRDIIYNVLVRYYHRNYSYGFCEIMTERIAEGIENGVYLTRGDIMFYIWMNTTGGSTAELASHEIQQALPFIQDTDRRSYNGKVG